MFLMISLQVQGPGPLQSMLVQDHMLYNGQAVASEFGEVVNVPHQSQRTRLLYIGQ
ncbi:hypothetical protein MTR67_050825 [Solanum verrucosum]|uniref:Uncharacterized protein n=1 Tax=Solanum verrucosum TaxID=315347 RepID=A0AAF1A1W3_SOLVR|nr:hypothetical protein MTR67_050825 [Solanum verrucosum]